ncbi:hypothetical protein AMECASPLE_026138 [Ameca splendens]|uniref:Uncharacterized protein n=1 Tax=Ameca splendens TaxID=208324 RepID=A0ABV0ZRW6_9TELE
MILLLCPNQRFKPLPRILLLDSASPALTQFLFLDYRILLPHWEYKPESLCVVVLLNNVTLRSRNSVPCLSTDSEKRFLSLPMVVFCRLSSRAFDKPFESYLLCPAEITVSVKSIHLASSSFPILLVVGLVSAILLIFLGLLLWHYRNIKDFWHKRSNPSQRTSQSFTANHDVNLNETYEYSCPPHDESTYSVIEMKNFWKERETVCPDVKTEATGKWSPAADAAVYSNIGAETSSANHGALYS